MYRQEMQKGVERLLLQEGMPKGDTFLAFNRYFFRWLEKQGVEKDFQALWKLPSYAERFRSENLIDLLDRVPDKGRFRACVIIGYDACLEEALGYLAESFRSLRFWMAEEPPDFAKRLDELYEEYGMVASLDTWRQGTCIQIQRQESCLFLDLSRQEKLPVYGMSQGSMWVDLADSEHRRRQIAAYPLGIPYLSLSGIWEREMAQTLDTVSKFEYNT